MASGHQFKELNVSHLKRPATVLIRKPLATNDELSIELENYLMEEVIIKKPDSARDYVGSGKIIAIYWRNYAKEMQESKPVIKYVVDEYNSRVMFSEDLRPKWEAAKPDELRSGLVITKAGERKTIKDSPYYEYYADAADYGVGNTKEYQVWIIDSSYDIPQFFKSSYTGSTTDYNVTAREKTNDTVTLNYGLNPKIVAGVPTEISSNKEFLKSTIYGQTEYGRKILNNKNIKVHKAYTLLLNADVTEPQSATMGWVQSTMQRAGVDFPMIKAWQDGRAQLSKDVQYFYDYLERTTKTNPVKPTDYVTPGTKFVVKNWFGNDLIKQVYTYRGVAGDKVADGLWYGSRQVNYVDYDDPDAREVLAANPDRFVTYKDIADAYIYFVENKINELEPKVDWDAVFKLSYVDIPVKPINYEHTVLEEQVITTTDKPGFWSWGFKTKVTSKIVRSLSTKAAWSFLSNIGDLVIQTPTESKQNNTHTLQYKLKEVPTIAKFKLKHYINIRKKYAKPRIEKALSLPSGICSVHPRNFLEFTNFTYEEAIKLRPTGTSTSYGTKASSQQELIEYFESAYFGNWAGIYITSNTSDHEQIAKYSNTKIYSNTLPAIGDILLTDYLGGNVDQVDSVSNKDVTNINVSRQTMGKSLASLVINNIYNKYNVPVSSRWSKSSSVEVGELIFEPMDEVFIYFPDRDGRLSLSFRGLISEVQGIVMSGYNSISITCHCPIKRLEITRTNVKPSLSKDASSGKGFYPWAVPEKFFETIDQWVPFIFMQGLSYFTSMLGITGENRGGPALDTPIITLNKKKQPIFVDPLLEYLWYRQGSSNSDQQKAARALDYLVNQYTETVTYTSNTPMADRVVTPGITAALTYYSKATTKKLESNKCISYNIYSQRLDGIPQGEAYIEVKNLYRTLAAQFMGTVQPSFILGASKIPVVFADYETNMEILKKTGDKLNFYIYSNTNGVVQFRPPQIDLYTLSSNPYTYELNQKSILQTTDLSFTNNLGVLDNQFTSSCQEAINDENLITWMHISGESAAYPGLQGDLLKVPIQNVPLAKKYGIRSQREVVVTGIQERDGLRIYGMALMDRNNKRFRTASAKGLAFGGQDINTTVYYPGSNTVYLVEGLTQEYIAGESFKFSASLTWGRRPIAKLSEIMPNTDLNSLTDIKIPQLITSVKEAYNNDIITAAYREQLMSILNNLQKANNPTMLGLLGTFIFNGYVWDGVSTISWEGLKANYLDSELGKNTGMELALGVVGNKSAFTIDDVTNDSSTSPTSTANKVNGNRLNRSAFKEIPTTIFDANRSSQASISFAG